MPHGVESLAGMCLGCPSDRTRLYALGLPLPSVRPLPPPDKDHRIRDGTPTHLDTQAGSSALLHLRLYGLCRCHGFLPNLSRRRHFFLVGSPRQIRGFLIPLPCRLFCFLEGLASLSPRLFATLQIPCSPPHYVAPVRFPIYANKIAGDDLGGVLSTLGIRTILSSGITFVPLGSLASREPRQRI